MTEPTPPAAESHTHSLPARSSKASKASKADSPPADAGRGRSWLWVAKTTFGEFFDDNAMVYAGAVAFYTALSFAPLLVVLLVAINATLGPGAEAGLVDQLKQLMGEQAASIAEQVLTEAEQPTLRSWAGVISLAMLLFSSTTVFAQLQLALNVMWDVKGDYSNGLWAFLRKRLLSLGMVLTIGFLLIVSLVASAVIQAVIGGPGDDEGWTVMAVVWLVVNLVASLAIFTLTFAAMFKYLPDAKVAWKDVWIGAAITAVLLTLGKWAIGTYLGVAGVGSAYGAAGSLMVFLVWVYYSCVIVFLGAEFTQVWSRRAGRPIQPTEHAVRRSDD
jgi:membrane protein